MAAVAGGPFFSQADVLEVKDRGSGMVTVSAEMLSKGLGTAQKFLGIIRFSGLRPADDLPPRDSNG